MKIAALDDNLILFNSVMVDPDNYTTGGSTPHYYFRGAVVIAGAKRWKLNAEHNYVNDLPVSPLSAGQTMWVYLGNVNAHAMFSLDESEKTTIAPHEKIQLFIKSIHDQVIATKLDPGITMEISQYTNSLSPVPGTATTYLANDLFNIEEVPYATDTLSVIFENTTDNELGVHAFVTGKFVDIGDKLYDDNLNYSVDPGLRRNVFLGLEETNELSDGNNIHNYTIDTDKTKWEQNLIFVESVLGKMCVAYTKEVDYRYLSSIGIIEKLECVSTDAVKYRSSLTVKRYIAKQDQLQPFICLDVLTCNGEAIRGDVSPNAEFIICQGE